MVDNGGKDPDTGELNHAMAKKTGDSVESMCVITRSYPFGGNGEVAVAVGGTKVQFPDISAKRVTIVALQGNGGNMYIGDSSLTVALGYELDAGASVTIDLDSNLNELYADTDNNTDAVRYIYFV